MFMRENRRKNGAPQPEQTAADQAADQRRERKLSTNEWPTGKPDDWRFSPNMSSCEAINNDHYDGGIRGDGPYGTSYEQHIHSVGTWPPKSPELELKS